MSADNEAGPRAEDNGAIRLTTATDKAAKKRIPLFYIDDKEYTMWKNPPPTVGLKYLALCRDEGTDSATAWLLETIMGTEGYEALMDYDDISDDQYEEIIERVLKYSVGDRGRPKARQRRTRRR